MIYFCMRENFSLSIVKQQHHGWSPSGKVGVPLVTRIPYPTLFHTISFPCARSENSSRESKPINVEKVLFLLAALIPAFIFGRKKQKSSRKTDTVLKKPKRLRHEKIHLRHPSVIKESIKKRAIWGCKEIPEKIIKSNWFLLPVTSFPITLCTGRRSGAAKMSELCVILKIR